MDNKTIDQGVEILLKKLLLKGLKLFGTDMKLRFHNAVLEVSGFVVGIAYKDPVGLIPLEGVRRRGSVVRPRI